MKYLRVVLLIIGSTGGALQGMPRHPFADTAGIRTLDTSNIHDVLHNRDVLPTGSQQRSFSIRENDTTTYQLQLALDKAGRPLYYFRNIFTPVCYTGECKPVFINFYWDLLGNYIRYDLPEGEPLTKLDHKVFKPADYEKLQEILAKPNSLLADLKITDLIVPGTENLADSVDARTGATLKTIKNEVIPGAVYTCYTLWQIAHGAVITEMERITETYNNTTLLHRFLSSGNYQYQYWALGKVMDTHGAITPGFETDIRNIVSGKNIFIARYILQQVHPDFLTGKKQQRWLWEIYTASSYPAQITILRKLKTIPLQAELIKQLVNTFSNANTEQSGLILPLLQQAPGLPLPQLAEQLTNADAEKAASIYTLLQQRKPENNYVKKLMYNYEKQINQ
ncbi:hypothetical protein [Chitinophaga sp.]|uniref:hypothetical protein n=1 Tax=Chitinophaga sp. TaxID=1869181 RepID=UPI002F94F1F6